jgi:cytochrome c553
VLSVLLPLLALALASPPPQDDPGDLRAGERMYREGVLPSGKPMRALVKGDVPTEGSMFSCMTCHLRSGMGSVEGAVPAPAISGPRLYAPRFRFPKKPLRRKPREPRSSPEPDPVRPAYTDATLARALRDGIDPAGRTLDASMPRFLLDDGDLSILIGYLKDLSAGNAPGVTDTTVRFASIVTEGVASADRDAMLATLEAYVADRNAVPKRQEARAGSATVGKPMYAGYSGSRRLELDRWELSGPPETWRGQLDALQRARPVFALLGGMTAGEWRQVHEFCEAEAIPCLFPITELPEVSETDWHTLYFSKGLYQEGETAARFLRSIPELGAEAPVIQLLRDTPEGRALARGFEEAWAAPPGRPPPQRRVLGPDEDAAAAARETLARTETEGVALLWLGAEDLSALWKTIGAPHGPRFVFVSSGLLGGPQEAIPEAARSLTYLTYQGPLPAEQEKRMAAVLSWLTARNVPLTRPAVQSRAYFIGWMLSSALARMGDEFHRDHLLDVLDTMIDQTFAIAPYERLSFGHGQRYASKGCHVVQWGPGPHPDLLKRSEWIVY